MDDKPHAAHRSAKRRLALLAVCLAVGVLLLVLYKHPPSPSDVAHDQHFNAAPANNGAPHVIPRANQHAANQPANTPAANDDPQPAPDTDPVEKPPDPDGPVAEEFVLRDGGPLPALMDWELTKTDYEAILANPQASKAERSEAGLRLRYKFYEWPGRSLSFLAGLELKQADYPELKGYTELQHEPGRTTVEVLHDPSMAAPLVRITRKHWFQKEDVYTTIAFTVFSSRAWAQRAFLNQLARGMGGKLAPAKVGDVWTITPQSERGVTADLSFARHNIFVKLDTITSDGSGKTRLTDLEALAEQMDRKIRADAVPGRTWEDIAAHRPIIERFRLNGTELIAVEGRNAVQVDFTAVPPEGQTLKAAIECENPVKGSNITIDATTWVWAETKDPYAVTKEQSGRVWAIAFLPNLLFTVAETSIVVKPKPPE
ncbi:MAG: hypothetical protein IT464_02715 [Planctomycetes bacterium]|nr:hypothetical protein [Planctomycetota bacterium]